VAGDAACLAARVATALISTSTLGRGPLSHWQERRAGVNPRRLSLRARRDPVLVPP